MKKLIIIAAVAFALGMSAHANAILEDVKVSYVVRQAFYAEFGKVKNVTWQKASNDMLRADFELDKEKVSAFFNEDGDHIATTVQKDIETLPAKLRRAIKDKFGAQEPKELFELISDEESAFFFSVEEGGKTEVYKAYTSGNISKYQVKRS